MSEGSAPNRALVDLGELPDSLGGDAACWAHLLCPECGIVLNDRGEHRPGCTTRRL